MQGAESPLDFIKNNTKPLAPAQPLPDVDPQVLANSVAVQKKEQELAEVKKVVAQTQSSQTPTPLPQETPKQALPEGAVVEKPEQDATFNPLELVKESLKKPGETESPPSDNEEVSNEDVSLSPEDSKEVNFKKLREVVKETKKSLQEKEELLAKTNSELEKFRTGEVVPETLQKQQARIAELERFEKIVSLKTSPEYQEKYIKPLKSITERLDVLAADYKIPPEMLKSAISIKNQAELNGFLSENFDNVGAMEAKQLITQARDLQNSAQVAENEPSAALQNLIEEGQRADTVRKAQQRNAIAEQSKSAWMDSLINIKKEGKILELIPKDGDSEYNDKYVNPILQAASSEYGKLVTMLAENGLTQLPKDVAYALSRLTQLAHASALSIESRKISMNEAQTLKDNVKRSTRYERPQIGGGFGKGGDAPPAAPSGVRAAADQLLAQIGAK